MRAVKRFLTSGLRQAGLSVSHTTDPEKLRSFFRMLRPVRTDKPLVRIGAAGDGGYLTPDDLEGVRTCFSPGVSIVSDFELALAERGVDCFLADASVAAPPLAHPRFDFEPKFLGPKTGGAFVTLQDWVDAKRADDRDMILQMDIEGAEYGVLYGASEELLSRFRIVIVEFHDLDRLFDSFAFEFLRLTFEKLCGMFEVVHIHPNNSVHPVRRGDFVIPPVIEVTFLRRDRAGSATPRTDFPHALDRANVRKRGDLALPACWWA